jgi:hypothetical protein
MYTRTNTARRLGDPVRVPVAPPYAGGPLPAYGGPVNRSPIYACSPAQLARVNQGIPVPIACSLPSNYSDTRPVRPARGGGRGLYGMGDVKPWPYKQGVRRRISGLGCAGCGGRCKSARSNGGMGDWSDFLDTLPQLITAGAGAASNLIQATSGGSSQPIVTPSGQIISTTGMTPAQLALLQAQLAQANASSSSFSLSSISPTTLALGVGGIGLLVMLVSR